MTIYLLILTTGCRQPIENPELADPIYADLNAELNAMKSAATSEQKDINETKEKIRLLPPRDPTRSPLQRQLQAAERKLVQTQQRQTYFEVRKELRLAWDQESYKKAFDENRPWPDPNEYAEYKKMKQLRSAPMVWDNRVPKTNRYSKKVPTPETKAKHGEGGGEGGGEHH